MTVRRRALRPGGPELSQIAFGTMRLPTRSAGFDPTDHLCALHDLGIDTHHSSHEYGTHAAYLDALAAARATGRRFRHIVKAAEPGFDDDRFDGRRLTALLDDQLSALGADAIDSLQWLFRTADPGDGPTRVAALRRQHDEVRAWAEGQMAAGKLRDLSVFPYSMDFAAEALRLGVSSTVASYLNLAELELLPLLDRIEAVIALRPLAGGRLTAVDPPTDALVDPRAAAAYLRVGEVGVGSAVAAAVRFPLLHPAVATIVVSTDSIANALAVVESAGQVAPDLAAFATTADAVAAHARRRPSRKI